MPNLIAALALVISALAFRETAEQNRVGRQQFMPFFTIERVEGRQPATVDLAVRNNGSPVRAISAHTLAFLWISCERHDPFSESSELVPLPDFFNGYTYGLAPQESLRAAGAIGNQLWEQDLQAHLEALNGQGRLTAYAQIRTYIELSFQDVLGSGRSEYFSDQRGFSRIPRFEWEAAINNLYGLPDRELGPLQSQKLPAVTAEYVRSKCR
jgi:hypothetical protein